MIHHSKITIIGAASGIGGVPSVCGQAPLVVKKYLEQRGNANILWGNVYLPANSNLSGLASLSEIAAFSKKIAKDTYRLTKEGRFFMVMGGDHSSAIGTWSGAATALAEKDKKLGLIWVDAHMDSHTMETTPSGNIHGMPLAALLGRGDSVLTHILSSSAKLLPQNVCLIGIRDYESEEYELLKKLGVKIYFIEDVKKQGFSQVFQRALDLISAHTDGFGISLDLDAFDPLLLPGSSMQIPNGIEPGDFFAELKKLKENKIFLGFEIVEYSHENDKDQRTLQYIESMLNAFF